MAGRDGTRQTMANSTSKGGVGVTISHQLMSTFPMAALGPPRDLTDTNTWSGGDNRPSTDIYLPNGRIRPSKKSKIILDAKEESERKVGSYLVPYGMSQSTLIKKSWAQGCGSADIRRRHICLPHDAVWCHPSHHQSSRQEARVLPTPT